MAHHQDSILPDLYFKWITSQSVFMNMYSHHTN